MKGSIESTPLLNLYSKTLSHLLDPGFNSRVRFRAVINRSSSFKNIDIIWEDVDNPEGFLRIASKQKGKKENRIPISTKVYEIPARGRGRGLKKVFRWNSTDHVTHLVKAAIRKAGLPESIHLHDMRRTFGSHLAMSGFNEKTIQDLMRHSSMASTIIYTKLSPEHLRKASESIDYGSLGAEKDPATK